MNPILKNILSIPLGWMVGSVVNMGLVMLGSSIFPIEGVDPNDMEALAAATPNLSYEYFIFPFLAHAVGTFVGAFLSARVAANRKLLFALIIGGLFFIGGIMVHQMIPGPMWFTVADLLLAYFPMAWLGYTLATKKS